MRFSSREARSTTAKILRNSLLSSIVRILLIMSPSSFGSFEDPVLIEDDDANSLEASPCRASEDSSCAVRKNCNACLSSVSNVYAQLLLSYFTGIIYTKICTQARHSLQPACVWSASLARHR